MIYKGVRSKFKEHGQESEFDEIIERFIKSGQLLGQTPAPWETISRLIFKHEEEDQPREIESLIMNLNLGRAKGEEWMTLYEICNEKDLIQGIFYASMG